MQNASDINHTDLDFQLILDSLPHVAWTANRLGEITFINKKWFDYVERDSKDSIFESWRKIIHPDMWHERLRIWNEAIAAGVVYRDEFLARGIHQTEYRWHIARTSVVKEKNGLTMLWVGSLIDIHEEKMFSQELEIMVAERTKSLHDTNLALLHTNQSLEQFAYIASHDLQEPLRKVKTFTTIFAQNYMNLVPEEGQDYIHKIHLASERMSALIKDVLNYSRITQDQSAMVKTDLNGVMNNVLMDFELLARELKAEFKVDHLPVIQAVPLQMNQLFYNLVGNALKFSAKGRNPVVEISANELSEEEKQRFPGLEQEKIYWQLVFKDNGIGFEQEFAEQIFMIFQRLHSKSDFEGTGIGLALCQKIAYSHQGLIWAEGKPGIGANFHIILPVKQ